MPDGPPGAGPAATVRARDGAVDRARTVLRRLAPEAAERLERTGRADEGAATVGVLGLPGVGVRTLAGLLQGRDSQGSNRFQVGSAGTVTVFVLDAGTPLGVDELALLTRSAPDPATTVFALNKADLHRDWRAVAERNRALLRAHARNHADAAVIAVSGVGEPGVAALDRALRQAVAGGAAREALLRDRIRAVAADGLIEAAAERRALVESLRRSSEVEALRAERQQLVRARGTGRGGHGQPAELAGVRARFQLARVDLAHEVAAQCRTLTSDVRRHIEAADRGELRRSADDLRQRLSEASERLGEAVAARLGGAERVAVDGPAIGAPEPRRRGTEDRMMIAVGASGGVGLGRLVVMPMSLVPAWDLISIPATLALGAGAAWWMVRSRAHLADRVRVKQWSVDVLADFRAAWDQAVLAAALEAEARAVAEVTRANADRLERIDRRLHAVDGELQRCAAERSAAVRAVEADLAELGAVLAELQADRGEPHASSVRRTRQRPLPEGGRAGEACRSSEYGE
ncbi:hypothetical protein G4X40_09065 [Rhodococcus sp. D2-41]|uniref:G domain-containing protein n=1 Tax=Speluncibacter jeojiensis TaxID=2710754 RepID=A0A9X4REE0_9ACTN|nr:hypothetical protein [Rhodococcus sp. D2-41]MDG3010302.1 hypothetical protein [Rhodococcus sp. D2-41]MDG3015815.1 hypothetical protein [Corynebacteriales bacterium D3-21]